MVIDSFDNGTKVSVLMLTCVKSGILATTVNVHTIIKFCKTETVCPGASLCPYFCDRSQVCERPNSGMPT